jgi:integrase
MTSVHRDGHTRGAWVVAYRPPHWRRGQKRGRKYLGKVSKAEATRVGEEIDVLCKAIDAKTATIKQVERAITLKLLTPQLARALGHEQLPEPDVPSIEGCYAAHPSTRREEAHSQADAVRHRADLQRFLAWSQIRDQEDVTLDLVQSYVDHLVGQGFAWDTRRHGLLPIRRACQMGARLHGFADPLYKLRLDPRRATAISIEAFTLADLRRALRWRGKWAETVTGEGGKPETVARCYKMGNQERAVILLGGFHGLRSSEIYRIRAGDLQDDVLQVGLRERKTLAGRRDLPLAPTAVRILEKLAKGKKFGALLIRPDPVWPRSNDRFSSSTFGYWCSRWLPHATGRALQAKHLRKAFGNIAITHGIDTRHIEAYLGHRAHNLASVTSAHYIIAAQAGELRPVAKKIEKWIRTGR